MGSYPSRLSKTASPTFLSFGPPDGKPLVCRNLVCGRICRSDQSLSDRDRRFRIDLVLRPKPPLIGAIAHTPRVLEPCGTRSRAMIRSRFDVPDRNRDSASRSCRRLPVTTGRVVRASRRPEGLPIARSPRCRNERLVPIAADPKAGRRSDCARCLPDHRRWAPTRGSYRPTDINPCPTRLPVGCVVSRTPDPCTTPFITTDERIATRPRARFPGSPAPP
jgi:hypothetical protein